MGVADVFLNILEKIGGKTVEVAERPISRIPSGRSIQDRLRVLKQMQIEVEKEKIKESEKEMAEIIEWRRQELQKPFSERLAEGMLKHFSGPIRTLSASFRGLDYDLYRANMKMSRDSYVALTIVVSVFLSLFAFAVGVLAYFPYTLSLLFGLLGFMFGFMYMRIYPKIVWKTRVAEVERELPYALRHMASLLSAGVGITEAMVSVATANYGVISEEFELMIRDMHTGASLEEALAKFEEKMDSESVSRTVKQMIRAIKFGGNLADILYKLAEDFAFDYRMKLVEYVQKINGISFVYMFLTIVMPTMFVVGILAGSIMARSLILPVESLALILLFAFPALSVLMVIMIKRGEPR
ncbi:type II secretion system F family protein [Thermococcus atlanticus]